MNSLIILHGLTPDELSKQIESIFDKKLTELLKEQSAKKSAFSYLSRKQVADILHVSLPTLHEWTKDGILVSYKIGNRVLYKSDEIQDCLRKRKFHY
jgi:excisionase family DNA binding protein